MTPPHHDNESNELQRTFSGIDAGGGYGGDGGILHKEISNQEGWCERLDTSRSQHAEEQVDVEKGSQQEDESVASGDDWEVRWGENDSENPRNIAKWRKWLCTYVVSSASLCV
jgi:hypothetical protein